MRWSKVRKLVEESFADSIRRRVQVHVANYPRLRRPSCCSCSYGWFAVDGKPLVHTDTHLAYKLVGTNFYLSESDEVANRQSEHGALPSPVPGDLSHACWVYLHSSVDDSLRSANPLVASLAVLNARVGKQRLRRMSEGRLHPLTRALIDFRLEAEKTQTPAKAS